MSDGALVRTARACEFLLGALFLSAAALKLANLTLFATQIMSYGVISGSTAVKATTLVVVPLEAALGVAMLAGLRLRGYVYYVSIAMLIFFSALVAYAWPEECGCFGPIKMGPWETLGKNVVMGAMALLALATLRKREPSDPDFGVLGKWIVTLVITGLVLYFTQDQVFNSTKYSPKPTTPIVQKQLEPAKPVVSPSPSTPTPVVVAPTPTEPAPTEPTPTVQTLTVPPTPPAPSPDTEAEPTAPTGTYDYPADAEPAFAEYTVTGLDGAPLSLATGQYLVALLNSTCEHCMATVPAINLLALRPDVPTVVALMQEPEAGTLDTFLSDTSAAFPALSLGNDMKFLDFIKTAPPRFTLINDGRPIKSWESYPPTAEDLQAAAAPK